MAGYLSPYTGQQVDSAVSAYISGGVQSAINTASGAAVSSANAYTDTAVSGAKTYADSAAGLASGAAVSTAIAYTDSRTSMALIVDSTTTSIAIPVLSGGTLYTYSQPATAVSVGSVVSNSIGDIIHFSAAAAAITIDLPAGLTVLLYDTVSSGTAYDLMVCDDRLLLKEVVSTTV